MTEQQNSEPKKDFRAALEEASKHFNAVMDEIEKESEAKWNALSKQDQLDYFCAVTRRIYQAEILDQGTYRWALYDVFGFGPEAYAPAQLAGYLDIHNCIYPASHDKELLGKFAEKLGIENSEEKIRDFLSGKL
jgi:hypothetical protein